MAAEYRAQPPMEQRTIVAKVQDLTDIELATLLCLVANQHCIIETEAEALDTLQEELQLVAANVFGLSAVVVHCSSATTLEDFSSGVLIAKQSIDGADYPKNSLPNRRKPSLDLNQSEIDGDRMLANVVIARDLNLAGHQIQIQALELLRTNRIFTHTALYAVPKPFLIVALISTNSPPLVKHLNDLLFISHYHNPEDGFANLEESSQWVEDDRASLSSVVHKTVVQGTNREPVIPFEEVLLLAELSKKVNLGVEVRRYLHNVLTFLRMHRAVARGISPQATKHFELLVRCLAPLHDLEYVTPSLVALAARKVYRHRVTIVAPENERSMQYGSDLAAVTALLEGVTAEQVIEDVLAMVEVPL